MFLLTAGPPLQDRTVILDQRLNGVKVSRYRFGCGPPPSYICSYLGGPSPTFSARGEEDNYRLRRPAATGSRGGAASGAAGLRRPKILSVAADDSHYAQ